MNKRVQCGANSLKKVLLLLAIFNFINLFLHIFSFYVPVVFAQLDYALYAAKIILYYSIARFLKKNNGKCFKVVTKCLKVTITLDVIEALISILNYSTSGTPCLLLLLICGKFIFDSFICFDLYFMASQEAYSSHDFDLEKTYHAKGKKWLVFNGFIIVWAFVVIFTEIPFFLYVFFGLLFKRFIDEIKIIKEATQSIGVFCGPMRIVVDNSFWGKYHGVEHLSLWDRCNNAVKICLLSLSGIILLIGSYLFLSYDYTDYNKYVGEEVNLEEGYAAKFFYPPYDQTYIYEYRIYNKMPKWTGLKRCKYGFVNTKTGKDTGPIYKELNFDKAGVSWDGKENFIDVNGDVISKASFVARTTVSQRQHLLRFVCNHSYNQRLFYRRKNELNEYSDWNALTDEWTYDFLKNKDLECYFTNGVVKFYSDFTGRYGLMNEDGSIAVYPKYDELEPNLSYILASVYIRNDFIGVINSKGELLFEDNDDYTKVWTTGGMVRYEIDSDNSDQCYLIDQNGNKLEGKYFWEYGTFDDILLVRKYQENDNSYGKNYTMLVIAEGKIIYETDKKYERVRGYRDDDGKLCKIILENEIEEDVVHIE